MDELKLVYNKITEYAPPFDKKFSVIAGPCSVESREQLFTVARAVKKAGADMLRGGAFKPRTSPYSFQGLGVSALKMLKDASMETGLCIVTEVLDPRDVETVAEYADVLQIGARDMQNYPLLKEVGKSGKPVLLKRGFCATEDEFLSSAEYILAEGNNNLALCERGIRTFASGAKYALDIAALVALKKRTGLKIFADPSHATGDGTLVERVSLACVAAGCSGLMLEVHPHPQNARSDNAQQLDIAQFSALMPKIKATFDFFNKICE